MRNAVRSISALAGLVLALTLALTTFAADAPTVEVTGVVLDTEGQPSRLIRRASRSSRRPTASPS